MKQKKSSGGDEAPGDGNRWTLTYLDMITLLFALFIMLYAMSSINEKKYEQIAKSFHSAFNNVTTSSQMGGGAAAGGAASGSKSGGAKTTDALKQIYDVLASYIRQNHLENEIGLENTGTYVQIHLKDVVLFEPNKATMLKSSEPIMKEIESALASVYDRVDHITISGHTANVVVDRKNSDAISWQLSTERAVTVLDDLVGNGLKQNKLSIQGYAHFDPIAPDTTDDGRAKNRRVEITVYKNPVTGTGPTGRAQDEKSYASSTATYGTDSKAPSSAASNTSSAASSGMGQHLKKWPPASSASSKAPASSAPSSSASASAPEE